PGPGACVVAGPVRAGVPPLWVGVPVRLPTPRLPSAGGGMPLPRPAIIGAVGRVGLLSVRCSHHSKRHLVAQPGQAVHLPDCLVLIAEVGRHPLTLGIHYEVTLAFPAGAHEISFEEVLRAAIFSTVRPSLKLSTWSAHTKKPEAR